MWCILNANIIEVVIYFFKMIWQFLLICFIVCVPSVLVHSVLWRCWLGGRKGIQPVKNWVVGCCMVICLERGVDLYMAQLMPLPLTVSCFTKIQIGFTFLVPAHLGSPGQRAFKRVCVCVCVFVFVKFLMKLTSLCGIRAIYIGGRFSRTWCMCSSLCEIACHHTGLSGQTFIHRHHLPIEVDFSG